MHTAARWREQHRMPQSLPASSCSVRLVFPLPPIVVVVKIAASSAKTLSPKWRQAFFKPFIRENNAAEQEKRINLSLIVDRIQKA